MDKPNKPEKQTKLTFIKQKKWVYQLKMAWIVLQVLLVLLLVGCFFAGGVAAGYFASFVHDEPIRTLSEIRTNISTVEQTSEVYFRNNQFIGYLRTESHRLPVEYEEVSEHLINAILATEDNEFFDHPGINVRSFGRAVLEELTSPGEGTGGSTITQQLVKNQFLSPERSFERKFNEMLLAMRVERFIPKEEILEAYMNMIYLGYNANGTNIEGVGAAAEGIFGVKAGDLNLAQAAYLAGMIQSPGRYTPFNRNGTINEENLNRGLERMKYVLGRMLETGRITKDEYDEALTFDIKSSLAEPQPTIVDQYPYLTFAIEEAALEILLDLHLEKEGLDKEKIEDLEPYRAQVRRQLSSGGYKIYTTIDKELYEALHQTVAEAEFGPRSKKHQTTIEDPETGKEIKVGLLEQVGGTLIHNRTGAILAMIEGRDFNESQVNFSRAGRQPGSAIKPVLDYAPAFELGLLQPASVIDDAPMYAYDYSQGRYKRFGNFSGRYYGLVTVRKAVEQSYNIPAIKAMQMTANRDPNALLNFMQLMKLNQITSEAIGILPSAIGGGNWNISVEELTAAFAIFANEGQYLEPYLIERIESRDGEVIYQHEAEPVQVFSPQTAFLITDMLRDVVRSGTASRIGAKVGQVDLAGKTGTTSDTYDYWFVGYTPEISLGLWRGYELNDSLSTGYSQRHQNLWADLFNTIRQVRPELVENDARFEQPEGIVRRTVCSKSGLLPSKLCQEQGWLVSDYFNAQYVPSKVDDKVINARLITVDGQRYRAQESTPDDLVERGVYVLTEKIEYPKGVSPSHRPADWELRAPEKEDPRMENGKVPNAPNTVHANRQGNTISLTWSKVNESDLAGYRVYRAGPDGKFAHIASIRLHEETAFTDRVGEQDHAYYVTAVDLAGQESEPSQIAVSSGGSADQFFNPDPPDAPSGLEGESGAPTRLSWQASPSDQQVKVYRVYVSNSENGPFTLLGETTDTSYTLDKLTSAGEHWFYVTAVNSGGESKPSQIISLTVASPSSEP